LFLSSLTSLGLEIFSQPIADKNTIFFSRPTIIWSSTITYLKPGISFGICRDDNVRLWRSKLSLYNNPSFFSSFLSLFFSLTHIPGFVIVKFSYTRLYGIRVFLSNHVYYFQYINFAYTIILYYFQQYKKRWRYYSVILKNKTENSLYCRFQM